MWLIMKGGYRERLFEGLTYYMKSIPIYKAYEENNY